MAVERFLQLLVSWAWHEPKIQSVVLVGSYARGAQRPFSDLDLILLTPDRAYFLAQQALLPAIWAGAKHPAGSVWGVYIAARLVFIRPGGRVRVCNASLDGAPVRPRHRAGAARRISRAFGQRMLLSVLILLVLSHFFRSLAAFGCILYTRHKYVPNKEGVAMKKITNKPTKTDETTLALRGCAPSAPAPSAI